MTEPVSIIIGVKELVIGILSFVSAPLVVMFTGWKLFLKGKIEQLDDHEKILTDILSDRISRDFLNSQAKEIREAIREVNNNTNKKLDHINNRVDEIYKILPK